MPEILPFIGTRYNSRLIEDLNLVLAPPYDIISPEKRILYYNRHPHNVIRLISGRDKPGDDEYNNKYIRAENYLRTWKRDGILVDDNKRSLYFYEQEFESPPGKKRLRRGLFALVKLEDYRKGAIVRHEQTQSAPKADRLKLLRATKCNLSPILVLYSDSKHSLSKITEEVTATPPWETIKDDDGVTHRLWVVSKKAVIEQTVHLLSDKELFIADGHHRYETALTYRDEMRQAARQTIGCQPHDYMMMYLTNFYDDGLVILPTHRVLSKDLGSGVEIDEVIEDLKDYFTLSEMKVDLNHPEAAESLLTKKVAEKGKDRAAFAMVLSNGKTFILALKKRASIDDMIPEEIPAPLKNLDVTILHKYMISQVWIGNPEIEPEEDDIIYTKDAKEAVLLLKNRKACAVLIMNSVKVDQLREVAAIGAVMPPKTTYFYPKLPSGLVMRDLLVKNAAVVTRKKM
jgi:uncharacterized protein (DUF1015 family)